MVEFKEMRLNGGALKEAKATSISQQDLTAECWGVQAWGLEKCKTCEYADTENCGGVEIRKSGMNSKGIKVPIGLD